MKYRTIVADPPWPMPWVAGANRKNGRGEVHPNWKRVLGYATMSVDEIAALPVSDLAEDDAHLYLWVPDRWLIDGDGGRIARAWGFDPLRCIIWAKKGFGLGKFPRPAHEAVIVCRRGKLPFSLDTYPSVQFWKRPYGPPTHGGRGIGSGRVHSAKPDGFLDDVERASPGPYLELFARRQRLGWDTWGNEALNHIDLSARDARVSAKPIGSQLVEAKTALQRIAEERFGQMPDGRTPAEAARTILAKLSEWEAR